MRAVAIALALVAGGAQAQNVVDPNVKLFVERLVEGGVPSREAWAFHYVMTAKGAVCAMDQNSKDCNALTEVWLDRLESVQRHTSANTAARKATQ